MEADDVLNLFESYWFEHGIFTNKHSISLPTANSVHQNHEELEEPKLSRIQTLQVRSQSDRCLSSDTSFSPSSPSPNSVIVSRKLQTIVSGKEMEEFYHPVAKQEEIDVPFKRKADDRRRRNKGGSKSLSDLEFEELKGFMDLGFVFSEEVPDPSLVSIVPGLQRLGKRAGEDEEANDVLCAVSRPYLSEAWSVLDQTKVNYNAFIDRRVPALGNQIDMKDQIRIWAHSVASAVK
ncbi:hypothetical protein RJ639_004453 [Escallonia herrerae]|uniref:Uncharacterized protein n=1 Tax=Escallonia herrerae TaxID=1293975 RepID=A0AA88W3W7_9ASTE|nr:hypothetical protein RJ639_004453 [Escallonia herrerae]